MYESVNAKKINLKIAQISALAEDISGVIIIYDLRDWSILYMSPRGLKYLGISLEEIKGMSTDDYHARFFNPEDTKDYIPKILSLLQCNTDETFTFFQQVRPDKSQDWTWHMSSIKILMRDENKKPLLTLTISFPIDAVHHVTAKASRLLEENDFLRKHYQDFARLGKREGEILKLITLGKSSVEIGKELCISSATADTHRKNIKQKLNTRSFYELCQYARAFDLI